jgi:hypothetical protein
MGWQKRKRKRKRERKRKCGPLSFVEQEPTMDDEEGSLGQELSEVVAGLPAKIEGR